MGFWSGLGHIAGGVCNAIPVVGHVKGVIHLACGDKEGASEAFHASTKSTCIIGTGAVVAASGGTALVAIVPGMATAVTYDVVSSKATGVDRGCVHSAKTMVKAIDEGNTGSAILHGACMVGGPALDGLGAMGGVGLHKLAVQAAAEEGAAEGAKQVAKGVLSGAGNLKESSRLVAKNAAGEVLKDASGKVIMKTVTSGTKITVNMAKDVVTSTVRVIHKHHWSTNCPDCHGTGTVNGKECQRCLDQEAKDELLDKAVGKYDNIATVTGNPDHGFTGSCGPVPLGM